MTYKVTNTEPPKFELCENDIVKSVLQNLYIIMSTRKGSIPMYRHFGLPMEFIDKPPLVAENIAAGEIRDAVEEFETRATIKSISFERTAEKMNYTLEVII